MFWCGWGRSFWAVEVLVILPRCGFSSLSVEATCPYWVQFHLVPDPSFFCFFSPLFLFLSVDCPTWHILSSLTWAVRKGFQLFREGTDHIFVRSNASSMVRITYILDITDITWLSGVNFLASGDISFQIVSKSSMDWTSAFSVALLARVLCPCPDHLRRCQWQVGALAVLVTKVQGAVSPVGFL